MADSEGVPEDDVGVVDVGGWGGRDPGRKAVGGFTGRLGYMSASGMDLVVRVCEGKC
jgi:hypothetical protein